jgi:hypothetical protein
VSSILLLPTVAPTRTTFNGGIFVIKIEIRILCSTCESVIEHLIKYKNSKRDQFLGMKPNIYVSAQKMGSLWFLNKTMTYAANQ